MRSSEVAAEAGVNVQTLRYYERRGLLPEPERLDSGYRSYGADAVRIVHSVKRAQQLGFSLEEIDSLLDLAAGGPNNCDAAKQMAEEKIGQPQGKVVSLSAMLESLQRLIETCVRPGLGGIARCSMPSETTSPEVATVADDRAMNNLRTGPVTTPLRSAISDIVTYRPPVRIVVMHVPDCPLVEQVRATVDAALITAGIEATIEEIEGVFASPTLRIDGVAVNGGPFHDAPSCRLDLPTEEDVLVALGASTFQEHAV